ncbi:MAG: tetratricopeptide repeat protein [Tissierellia bacterium]|jgi:tetratricopeptide (TPR) repeat protein|nr:tetratricopeptide repeat protein [Tissierellia bacterium]
MNKEELIKKAKEYELNNEWQLALDIYDKLYNDYPKEEYFLEKKAWCYSRLLKYDDAIKHFIMLTEKEPNTAKWCYCVGYQYYMKENWRDANKWFEKALLIYHDYLIVLYRYAYSLRQLCGSKMVLKKDEFWTALKLLVGCDFIWRGYSAEQKKKYEKTYASICFLHAKLLIERNNIDNAIKYLEKALLIKPESEEYKYQLSKNYLTLGNIEKAKEVFPRNLKKYYVNELEIDILIAEKKHLEAIEKYKDLLKYRKKDYIYRKLGMQYYEINNLNDAILCILHAEKINNNNHLTQFAKAKILYKAGFLAEAKKIAEISASLKVKNYSSEFIEAVEFSKTMKQIMDDKSYLSDNEQDLNNFIHQLSTEKDNSKIIGRVKRYNSERGFGFIECNNIEYFFHISNVCKELQDKITKGMMFSFLPVQTAKGLSAINISKPSE